MSELTVEMWSAASLERNQKMATKKDVTKLVERLEAFEDRLGVRLESLSAHVNYSYGLESLQLELKGELHPKTGTKLQQTIELVVAVYDSSSRVVESASTYFNADDFFGFDIFSIDISIHKDDLKRILVFPKVN